jgi:tetratricopeptide (TPR) repeat protein
MPRKSSDLFRFWDELKRRKVVKASLVYLAVAFGILQAAGEIFPRLGLPDWTVTFVLVLLIIVFILVVVLTWVYDITPEGITLTKTVESESKEEEKKTPKTEPDLDKGKTGSTKGLTEDDLQKRVLALENQLKEARKITLRSALPLLVKKLALPFLIMVLLILVIIYKQKIVEVLGFGNAKREIAREHVKKAVEYINAQDFENANNEIDLALESDPGYSYAWSSRAAISIKQGDLNQAIMQTVKAVDLDPSNGSAGYNLAYALEDKNDSHQAIEWYLKAIEADSTLVPAYSALGRLYNNLNQHVDAIFILNLAKKKYPKSDTIYLIYKNLGNAYLLQDQNDSALKYLELSNELNPSQPETIMFLAKACEASGKITRSIELWQNYIELEDDTAKTNAAIKHRKELAVKQLQDIIK